MVTINDRPKSDWNGMIMFSDVPNIIEYSNTNRGNKAYIEMWLVENRYEPMPSGQTITINGETIISTTDISNATGRYFYLGTNSSLVIPSIVDALRNCPNLAANYDIRIHSSDAGQLENALIVEAKQNGSKYNITYGTTITYDMAHFIARGNSTDNLMNESFAKVYMQIYKYTDFDRYGNVDTYGDALNDGEYVTTMVKTYYGDRVAFDISPVLSTFVEYGRLVYFRFNLALMTSSGFEEIEDVHNLYATVGYRNNFSQPYIPKLNVPCLMQHNGNGIDWSNLYSLYVYKPNIKFSWVSEDASSTFTIKYLDSAYNVKYSNVVTASNNNDIDVSIDLDKNKLLESSYIAIQLPKNRGNLLYTVIKGINAADDVTRIYWRNEYGGISFFDFTSTHSSELSINSDTYSMGNLDYYKTQERMQEMVYGKNVIKTYSLTSHIVDSLGRYIFESLAKSKKIWTEDDESGIIDDIILTNVKIDKVNENQNLYNATIQYYKSRNN